MRNITLHVPFFLCFFFFATELIGAADYEPADKILLNCGGPPDSSDADGLKWTTDVGSKFTSSATSSTTSPVAIQDPAVPQVPYMNARIFRLPFTYTFPVAPGRKFLRLHFYSASYASLNTSNALFSVTAQSYTLLRNFSVAQATAGLNYDLIVKEYSINVEGEKLSVTFAPSTNASNAYAFVNGIEIVSMPDIYSSTDGTTLIVGTDTPFTIDNSTALENLYRLNVGGNSISPPHDTGLFRSWIDDVGYLYGAACGVTEPADQEVKIEYPPGTPDFIAPVDVYRTARSMGPSAKLNVNYNLTWILSVDSGFSYLVRLHFCDCFTNITKINQRVFDIFLNNQTVQEGADVIGWAKEFGLTHSNGVPMHKDYVVFVPHGEPRQDLLISLNLAGPNPDPPPKQDINDPSMARLSSHGKSKNHTGIIAGVVSGGVVLVLLFGVFAFATSCCGKHGQDSSASEGPSGLLPLSLHGNSHSAGSAKTNTTSSYASSLPSNLCRHFSFAEIKVATNNFDDALLLGVGGFGKVYKGEIDGGTTKVAIKRGNPLSEQGVHEFQTEIEMLSKLRHRHLVSLIGYCEENTEMILVYDYMAYGTLREHLYKTQKPPLPWKQRLEICIGAARGLRYLHTGAKHTIIHCDVKTTNILLDEKWVAKVSDFGLSKTGPTLDNTHVSTVVKGSFGYWIQNTSGGSN